ncbi:hypothetical protein [Streptomyces sp. NPDC095613]|uniref:hypothetical protein n=1 Tax=Streptomyces sp. NPDC095613 TaxID=3155540 RepID=UPI003317FA31
MRVIRAMSAALLTVGVFALTAPPAGAAAAGGASFRGAVSPATVAPGGRVTLSVTGCAASATASAAVFDTVTVPSGRSAAATVDWDAEPGSVHTVTFTCAGAHSTARLTIAGAGRTAAATTAPTAASTSLTPVGVRGGLGGSMGGGSAAQTATGAGLVVVAITGGVYAVRRRAAVRAH